MHATPARPAAGALDAFHPVVAAWFSDTFAAPTGAQALAWPHIKAGRSTLVAAPTGSGKTLTAFLSALDDLVRDALAHDGALPDETLVVYVSPLKALSNDIHVNLEAPLAGIAAEIARRGLPVPQIRTAVRTGDTTQAERVAHRKHAPHILVTTPESLYVLLSSESGRRMLASTRTVIVDEIHALANAKRGSHLALSLERLDALVGRKLPRIGLSATQKPVEAVARFLVGGRDDAPLDCAIVDTGHTRTRDLALELPPVPLGPVMANDVWERLYDRIAELAAAHRTTLVFVNTRRMAERAARHLADRLGADAIAAHHGSLAKEHRFDAEQRLKHGKLKLLVATASLELGIDIGDVELVCQLGSPRGIAPFLQRVGRSGHHIGGVPKGRLFPLSRDELVECAALLDCVRRGELDVLRIPRAPLDVLAQQLVAEVACREWDEHALYRCVTQAAPYATLARETFDEVLKMLAEGFTSQRGARAAYLHRDVVAHTVRGRRGARLAAVTSGGTIPDNADYAVLLEPQGVNIGTVNEDFAVESLAGDVFQLGNQSYRIIRIETGRVRVEDAHGQAPNIPFWLGEAPARSDELSAGVARLRARLDALLARGDAAGAGAALPVNAASAPAPEREAAAAGQGRREPAAADRHEDRVNRPLMLAQDLHRDRALARDHVRIVERMDEREAALGLHLHRVRVRVAVRFARLDHLDGRSAVRAHRVDLHLRRRHRHDDHRLHVHPRGRERDALRMVARRRGDHPARERVGRDVRHLVVRAAQLEREHRLVVLALQVDGVAQPRGQVARAFELGFERDVVHPGGQDFLQIIVGGHEEARKSVDATENGNDSANLRRFGLGRMATDRPDGESAVARPPSAD
ncbi:DEAD/DEAH box helicase [Burkholderia pseudomallei]|nr:DEAD/DEAH box helicase [Burkholderia pseudomallei]